MTIGLGTNLAQWVLEGSSPSAYSGAVATPDNMGLLSSGYGANLIFNGSFELWSSGTSVAPDLWSLTGAGATISRDATNTKDGLYACSIAVALNTATVLEQNQIPISATQNQRLRGAYVSASAWVKASVGARVTIQILDGVGTTDSVPHTGSGNFELLTVVRQLDTLATKLQMDLSCASGAVTTVVIDSCTMVEGETPCAYTQNPADLFLKIDNFQSTAPANSPVGNLRGEMGRVTTSASADVTVTFSAAFGIAGTMVAAGIVMGVGAAIDNILSMADIGTTTVLVGCYDSAAARVAKTGHWMVIGLKA